MPDVTLAVLAGGQSRRMGQNKSFVAVQGKPMIERVLDSLRPLDLPIMLMTSLFETYAPYGLPMVADLIPDQGALGGIYTALYHSTTPYVLCVACDMPFLNTDVLRSLLTLHEHADISAACIDGVWQTFPAVYSKRVLPLFQQAIQDHRLQIQQVFNRAVVHPIPLKDIRLIDPDLRTFTNINAPHELLDVNALPQG